MDLLEIHVTADTGGSGIEVRRAEDPAHLQYVTPDELGVSAGLASKLRSWQGWFDGVWELCGADERFAVLGDRFDDIGKQLAEEMAK